MLVVTRTEGQSILIGDDVRITVVSTRGGQMRFGIRAHQDVVILREELTKRSSTKNLHDAAVDRFE